MKKLVFWGLLVAALPICAASVSGQVNPPSVADNANIQDNDIKMRSVELERVKRQQAAAAEAAAFAPINAKIDAKFPEIKEDFEGIQTSQAAIVTAYTAGKTIDYAVIESAADSINKKAKRLDSNLFPTATTLKRKDEPKESKETPAKTQDLKTLIVELDNAIGSFVASKIFANLRVVEPEVAIKTRTDLLKIQELSEKIGEAAKNQK